MDATDHPVVMRCWYPVNGLCRGERPTISEPRHGKQLGLVHLCDARIDDHGHLQDYAEPGSGTVEIERLVHLLRGIGYDGYVIFDWPKLWVEDLAEPDKVLPKFKEMVARIIDAEPKPLSAYKTDKNAPKFRQRAAAP